MNSQSDFRPFSPVAMSLVLLSSLVACGARSPMLDVPEDETPLAGGTGGTSATPGTTFATGGTSGTTNSTGGSGGAVYTTGGTGGGFVGGCEYPSCVWGLLRDCLPDGQCTQDDSSGFSTTINEKICCGNGVSENVNLAMQASGNFAGTVTVTKNGQSCYSVELNISATASTGTYVYRDAGGGLVAKASLMSDGSQVVECANGETLTLPSNCPPDGSGGQTPIPGVCP
jgi:hypothetical protein